MSESETRERPQGRFQRRYVAGERRRSVCAGEEQAEAGSFWSRHVKGDTLRMELWAKNSSGGPGFDIDQIAIGDDRFDSDATRAICGANDMDNAVCYASSHPTEYNRSRAVARLLINGNSLCTGWLASASNHLITNEHCISNSSSALNTDYEFASEAPNCSDGNCQLCYTGDIYSGANFLRDNANLDYALVQISSGNPASIYGYLGNDNRDAVVGERIYIPQHPGGRAKELALFSSHSADSTDGRCHVNTTSTTACTGSGYTDVG